MLKKIEKIVLKEKKDNKKKGYTSMIDNYIVALKSQNLKIDLVEISLNETGQIDVKIKAKEG